MLQLPEQPRTACHNGQRKLSEQVTRKSAVQNAAAPFYDLEGSIGNAKMMSSIVSVLADKLVSNVHAYRGLPEDVTADQISSDLSDPVEQLLFASYELEKMLRDLDETFEAIVLSNPRQEQR